MTRTTTRLLIGACLAVAAILIGQALWPSHAPALGMLALAGSCVPWDIGSCLSVAVGNVPVAAAAGTRNGAAIDRQGFLSAVLSCSTGAITGAPSAQTVDAKVQDSADGSTGWADYKPDGVTVAAITQITAASAKQRKAVNLVNAKRYIRVVEVVGFTGGTTPTIGVQEEVILGGASEEPPA